MVCFFWRREVRAPKVVQGEAFDARLWVLAGKSEVSSLGDEAHSNPTRKADWLREIRASIQQLQGGVQEACQSAGG